MPINLLSRWADCLISGRRRKQNKKKEEEEEEEKLFRKGRLPTVQ